MAAQSHVKHPNLRVARLLLAVIFSRFDIIYFLGEFTRKIREFPPREEELRNVISA